MDPDRLYGPVLVRRTSTRRSASVYRPLAETIHRAAGKSTAKHLPEAGCGRDRKLEELELSFKPIVSARTLELPGKRSTKTHGLPTQPRRSCSSLRRRTFALAVSLSELQRQQSALPISSTIATNENEGRTSFDFLQNSPESESLLPKTLRHDFQIFQPPMWGCFSSDPWLWFAGVSR